MPWLPVAAGELARRRAGQGGQTSRSDGRATRLGVAAAPLADHPADPWHLVRRTHRGEHDRGRVEAPCGRIDDALKRRSSNPRKPQICCDVRVGILEIRDTRQYPSSCQRFPAPGINTPLATARHTGGIDHRDLHENELPPAILCRDPRKAYRQAALCPACSSQEPKLLGFRAGRRLRFPSRADTRLCRSLNMVRIDNCHDQPREALLYFRTARGIVHLDATPFSADQTGLAQRAEVLRKSGSRNRLLADLQEIRTVLRTGGPGDVGKNGDPHRIGERVQDSFDRHVFERRMEEGFHPDHHTRT